MENVSDELVTAWFGTLAASAALLIVLATMTLVALYKRLRRP